MGRVVQLLRPAAGAGTVTLDMPGVEEVLGAEHGKDMPLVVMAIVGPRCAEKTGLLEGVLQAISGVRASWTVSAPSPCGAGQPGPAGIAVWSPPLPVVLQTGGSARLLLMDVWGPFDECCPPDQRAAVLTLAALLSSVLVVHMSAADTNRHLDDLFLLQKLGEAAQDVKGCNPLQQVLFLMRHWIGTAPAGTQADFEPLYYWAQGRPAAERALLAVQEASDWYDSVSLFLDTDLPQGPAADGARTSDPVALLASQTNIKRFGEEPVTAACLNSYLHHLADAVAQVPCDAATLVRALVKADQALAVHKAVLVYQYKMKKLEVAWQTSGASEQDVRAAHDRAVHEAQLQFMMIKKMDYENLRGEEAVKSLVDSLEMQYKEVVETFSSRARQREKEAGEQNDKLRLACTDQYQRKMQHAIDENPLMSVRDLMKVHDTYRLEAVSTFDDEKVAFGRSGEQQHMELHNKLEELFRTYADRLDKLKMEEEKRKAQASGVARKLRKSLESYSKIMEAVQPARRRDVHELVQLATVALFDQDAQDMPAEQKSEAHQKLLVDTEAQLKVLTSVSQTGSSVSDLSRLDGMGRGRLPGRSDYRHSALPALGHRPGQVEYGLDAADGAPMQLDTDPHLNPSSDAHSSKPPGFVKSCTNSVKSFFKGGYVP